MASNAESTEAISRRISLDNVGGGGSEVRFGDLQLIPVARGLVWVRPYYVSVPQNSAEVTSVTEYRGVIVSYNDRAVLEDTVSEALAELFPGFDGEIDETIDVPTEPGDGDAGTDTGTAGTAIPMNPTPIPIPIPAHRATIRSHCSRPPTRRSSRPTRRSPTATSACTRRRSTKPGS